MEEQRPWHRLFGLSWIDFFRGLPVTVELEKDLSLKKQLLDVLVIRKDSVLLDCLLPDGFDVFARYNLLTFKSHQEKLSIWTLNELVGHYVNLRKQVSPTMNESDLLTEEDFRLFAVSVRYPQQLVNQNVRLEPVKPGVYNIDWFGGKIRLVVVNQLSLESQNAFLHLFSSKGELLNYGVQHYRQRSSETSTLLYQLFERYQQEIHTMPDALEEFARETIDQLLKKLPPEKRLAGLTPEDRLKGLTQEEKEAMLRILTAKQ